MDMRGTDFAMLLCLAHGKIADANRKSCGLPACLYSFPLGSPVGKGRQASRTASILLFWTGRQTQCRCRSPVREENKRTAAPISRALFPCGTLADPEALEQLASRLPRCFCCGLLPFFFSGE